jgi:putative transposase
MLTVLDEYTREALCVAVKPKWATRRFWKHSFCNTADRSTSGRTITAWQTMPASSRRGPEFIAINFQIWLTKVDIKIIRIYPGSPWENGYNERFNGTLRR